MDEDRIKILQYGRGRPEKDWPYKDYPEAFPGAPARLVEINDEAQEIIRLLNEGEYEEWELLENNRELNAPRHQYGGEPYLVQRDTEYRVACPVCERAMPFLANIGADCLDPRDFVTNEYVQVLYHFCQKCHVVGAFNQCG